MAPRYLVVIADDYGIGPETSRAILELAGRGVVTGTVLLVNSPHAAAAVAAWRRSGLPLEVGWHPNLVMDPPSAPPGRVPTLLDADGCLLPLGRFLMRLALQQIRPGDIERELGAQFDRFVELVGHAPTVVNAHQHTMLFPPVGAILRRVLKRCATPPYVRRVREPWAMLRAIPGARVKRTVLTLLGRYESWRQEVAGYPGNDWLAGITDPRWVRDPDFFVRWLTRVPGRVVELACHPGHPDPTLLGRDCHEGDGLLQRRVDELHLLNQPSFPAACRRAGFMLVPPSALLAQRPRGLRHAA
jgi:predicted glycoside hydrolase/deacetylase ChbG (UPF0249 family)